MSAPETKTHYRDDRRRPALFQCPCCGVGYKAKRKHLSFRLINWPHCRCSPYALLNQVPSETPGVLIVGEI